MKLPGSSTRTFLLFPLLVFSFEFLTKEKIVVDWVFIPLLAWGWLQYYLAGSYRLRLGGGGPGMEKPPERLVTGGPYAWTRNPMYLGHLIFLVGLALTLQSLLAAALALFSVFYFLERVRRDEHRLGERFGEEYAGYCRRVKRWIPGIF